MSREVGLSPSAEFMNVKVAVERMYARVVTFTELRAVISAFGKLDSVGGWQYDVTPSRPDVRGNREGVLVVMSPKGADVRVAVDARARVRENFLTKVLSRSGRWTDEDFIDLKSLDVPLTRAVPMTEQQLQSRFTTGFADLVLGKGSMVAGENAVVLPASS